MNQNISILYPIKENIAQEILDLKMIMNFLDGTKQIMTNMNSDSKKYKYLHLYRCTSITTKKNV